jgi:O-antigen/teichoic acid export membrane protein
VTPQPPVTAAVGRAQPDRLGLIYRATTTVIRRPLSMVLMNRATLLVINIATGILTARVLNPAGRGQLAALVVAPLFFAGVTTIGLPTALIYHLRRRQDSPHSLVWAAVILSGSTGLLTAVAGWWIIPLWLKQQPAAIIAGAQLFALATPISSIMLTGRAAWESEGRFWASSTSLLMSSALTLVVLGGLWWAQALTPMTAAAAYILTGLAPLSWVLVSLWSLHRPQLRGFVAVSRRLLEYGARSYGADLCGTLAQYTDQALVLTVLKPEAMGVYVVALSLSRVLNVLHGSIVMMLFPRLVGLDGDDVMAITARAARFSTLFSTMAGVVMAAMGPLLLRVTYGRAYVEGSLLLSILVGEAILSGLIQVLLQPLLAFNRPGVATLIQVIGLAASVPMLMTLVPIFGLEGAGLGLLLSTALRLVLLGCSYPLVLGVSIPRPWLSRVELAELARYADARWTALRGAGAPVI